MHDSGLLFSVRLEEHLYLCDLLTWTLTQGCQHVTQVGCTIRKVIKIMQIYRLKLCKSYMYRNEQMCIRTRLVTSIKL